MPSYLNMFIPSLNNYNTRLKMALGIPLCGTIEGEKSMSLLGPYIWNELGSNIKRVRTTSFTQHLKKGILSIYKWQE